jgi:hypothetical protein
MKRWTQLSAISLVLLISCSWHAQAQSQEKVYSTLLLNFSRGIQWPPSKRSGEKFIIGVFEYPPLAMELTSMLSSLRIDGKKIEVRELHELADISELNVLFIPAFKAKQLQAISTQLAKSPTLIVTNKTDLVKKGSDVNLILVEGKLRYEINCKAIESRGMKVSANIKEWESASRTETWRLNWPCKSKNYRKTSMSFGSALLSLQR